MTQNIKFPLAPEQVIEQNKDEKEYVLNWLGEHAANGSLTDLEEKFGHVAVAAFKEGIQKAQLALGQIDERPY